MGKQTPVNDVALPTQKRLTSSHKASTQAVQWSEDEQRELDNARDWRHRVRLEKRILHNRTAVQLERHVLSAFDIGQDIECNVCHKKTKISNLSKFVAEKCGGICDRDAPLIHGGKRASVQIAKRVMWVQTHNEKAAQQGSDLHVFCIPEKLDDELMCTKCEATHACGWRRF